MLAGWDVGGRFKLVRIDPKNKLPELLPTDIPHQHEQNGRMAVSMNGKVLAATSDPAFRVAIYDLDNRKEVRRLGPSVRVPVVVGWSANSRGVAWGYQKRPAKNGQRVLSSGLDLGKLEHLSRKELRTVQAEELPKDWKLKPDRLKALLIQGTKQVSIPLREVLPQPARLYKDQAGKPRLLVVHQGGTCVSTVDPDSGKVIATLGRNFSRIADLAVSPDRKYLLIAGGGMSLEVVALDQPGRPVLQIMAGEGGDWVVWTKEGYYAGTPGGEKLIGWKVVTALDRPARYYPALIFHKKLYRPDVIQKLLETGTVKAALKTTAFKTRDVTVNDVLPPRVSLRVEQDPKNKAKVVVHATAESSAPDQPVQMLRLLVDGRPLPDRQGIETLAKGQKKVSVKWTISNLPGGQLELKVLARCPDVTGLSAHRVVNVPTTAKNRPVLHVVAVGINYAGKPNLELGCPKNDAEAVASAFSGACTGSDNLFRQSRPAQRLLEKDATTKGVLAALGKIRKGVKPQDLVVFFYAGHGVRDGKDFYLLTYDAELKNLAKTALSGEKLRDRLATFPCQVLILLDACHSGAAVRGLVGFKPATDDASRQLADEECGATLLAAAMGYEKALEPAGGKNGLFTQGLIKALGKTRELPYNRRDGRQYVHHLFSYVFDEVKSLSKDRQHPFLSLPWTTESYPLRQLTKGEEEASR